MKFKTTKKSMKENYGTIISMGYCEGQSLLAYEQPIAYSTRVEGWACDYYVVGNVLISTGYAPIQSRNSHADYNMIKKYNNMARAFEGDYEARKAYRRELLEQFIKEATTEKEG